MTPKPAFLQPQDFEKAIRSPDRRLLWDGGMGTALIERGLRLSDESPESWLWTHPEQVAEVHRGFAEASACVLQTNTFGLVRLLVGGQLPIDPATGRPASLGDTVDRAVALALSAAAACGKPAPALVAAIGPTGQPGIAAERLAAAYREVATELVRSGVSAIHLETCFDPVELRLAVRAVREVASALPLLVSLTVTHGQQGLETPLGVPLFRMLRELVDDPPALIGANCSQNADRMRGAVSALAQWAQSEGRRLPVLARPQLHSGAPDCKRKPMEPSPQRFAEQLVRLFDEGATAVGGCCGVTAAHLAAVPQAIEGFLSPLTTL